MMRREFISLFGGAAAAWPLAARAQQGERMRRIGVLMGVSEDDPETKARVAAFQRGLERRGWLEGRNLHLDYRFTAARGERLPALAKELVALQPDLILAHSTGAAAALQRESRTIPIVFVNVSDPIGSGFVASLARPGGNLTGVLHLEASIVGKWLAMACRRSPMFYCIAIGATSRRAPHQSDHQTCGIDRREAKCPALGARDFLLDLQRAGQMLAGSHGRN